MLKLATALLILSAELFACAGDFSTCRQKLIDSHSLSNGQLKIALSGKKRLLYSNTVPEGIPVVKADPFLGLYLLDDANPFAFPFTIGTSDSEKVAAIDALFVSSGRISTAQQGLSRLGRTDEASGAPAIISDACCQLMGIVTPKGVIEKAYLEHFLQEGGTYADAGFRVAEQEGKVVVTAVDPYFHDNPFQNGDELKAFDGKDIAGAAALMKALLFAPEGSVHSFTLLRKGERKEFAVTLQPRFGGGLVSDTFLEREGIYLDEELRLMRLGEAALLLGLREGDRLVALEGSTLSTQDALRQAVSQAGRGATILIERNGFQFFIRLP